MQGVCFNCFHYAPEGKPCPYCGYDPQSNIGKYRLALRPGTILANRYVIGRVLGQGGFGITYVAFDDRTKSRVAIKEYMPTDFAFRDEGTSDLKLNSSETREDYEFGRQRFLKEARTLAEFVGNEHIIAILYCFEKNGTADFAMEYHKCSEVNYTTTGVVLLLALPGQLHDGILQNEDVVGFSCRRTFWWKSIRWCCILPPAVCRRAVSVAW